jgi:hypothetical protein
MQEPSAHPCHCRNKPDSTSPAGDVLAHFPLEEALPAYEQTDCKQDTYTYKQRLILEKIEPFGSDYHIVKCSAHRKESAYHKQHCNEYAQCPFEMYKINPHEKLVLSIMELRSSDKLYKNQTSLVRPITVYSDYYLRSISAAR